MYNIQLKNIANKVRKDALTAVYCAKSGHPGGSLSAADIYTYLYFEEMNIDPENPKKQTETVLFSQKDIQLQDIMQLLQTEDFSQ